MKSLTIKTLVVAVAVTLWGTPSMAATVELSSVPVSTADQTDRQSVTAATAPVPLYALTRLDAQTLAKQEMTEQELKAVEGGASNSETVSGLYGALTFNLGWYDFADGMQKGYCGC